LIISLCVIGIRLSGTSVKVVTPKPAIFNNERQDLTMANVEETRGHDTSINGPATESSKAQMSILGPSVSDTAILNGHSSAVNGDKPDILDRRASKCEPLKEVTNTNAAGPPASSEPRATSNSTTINGFKIPPLPRHKTSVSPDDTIHATKSPHVLESNVNPALPRWSSAMAQSPRRNSFPSTRKDGLEDLRILKAEAKLAKESSAAASIASGTFLTRRKNSIPGPVTGPIIATGADGYFTIKPDSRSRSTTTPGTLPTPRVVPIRRGSHIAENRPMMTPRLDILRRDSARQEALPTTLWDYLMIEMENFDVHGVEEYKKERLSNFLRIPQTFEKVCYPGGRKAYSS